MARTDEKSGTHSERKQRLRYKPAETLSETWEKHSRLGAVLLAGERSRMFSGRLGMCARKCNSTLKQARQVVVLIDGANPRIWSRVKSGQYHPDGPSKGRIPRVMRTQIVWIVARAFRDFHQLMVDENITREIVDEIAEGQRNAISVLGASPPAVTADAADELTDESSVKRQRQLGSTAVAASNGSRLR